MDCVLSDDSQEGAIRRGKDLLDQAVDGHS